MRHRLDTGNKAAARRRYLGLFELAPDAVIVTDPGGRIRDANRPAGKLLTVSPRHLAGKPLETYLGRRRSSRFLELLRGLLRGEALRRHGFELRSRRAVAIPVEVSAIVVRQEDGAPDVILWLLRDVSQYRALEDELRRLSLRLMTAQDEERRRIALDLHDSMGQNLAALQLRVEIAEQQAPRLGEQARRHLRECLRLARACVAEARTLADVLHPPMLEDVGLAASLEWQARRFAEQTGVRVEVVSSIGQTRFAAPVEIALFRVAQESLTNVWRHAGATAAEIRLEMKDGALALEVEDDGRGIATEPPQDRGPLPTRSGVGIVGMRERLSQIGGRLTIDSSPRGTTVRAVVGADALASPALRSRGARPAALGAASSARE